MQDKAKESCMVSFRRLLSYLKLLSNNNLKGTRYECGFERAFAALFDQDIQTFTCSMLLNLDQLEKQLDKEEFQEIRSIDAFRASNQEKAKHKRECDRRINDRMTQSKEGNIDSSKAFDAGLVVMKSNETKSKRHVSCSRSRKDTYAEDADINSVNDKQPMAEVQLTAKHNILANKQQHYEQSESTYDTYLLEKVDRNTTHDSTNMSYRGRD
nr:hypothetical protein [Tanacetum cinerariifolium]